MNTSRELTVACSCNATTHTFSLPIAKLPLPSHLCSCNTSRRISGSLLTSYINITHDSSPVAPDMSTLTPYRSSNKLTRHFCSTCGTHMYLEYSDDGHFEAATGTLQVDSTQGVVEYKSCMWLSDTRDGGASTWFLSSIDGKEIDRWAGEAGESDRVQSEHYASGSNGIGKAKEPVYAHCHCRGVEFWITPPGSDSKDARSNFPDLMVPYHRGPDAAKNLNKETWWLRDGDTRFLAGTCMCHSCRRASGFDITFWAFVPNMNIFLDEECTIPFPQYDEGHENKYWGTMKTYCSSEGVTRTFCGRCGANVFWDGGKEKGREGLIDVAVGLLDARSGARAEELLSWWTDRVSFEEDAVNKCLARALAGGLRKWEKRRCDEKGTA